MHTPLTTGDATNYPVDGDSCSIHYEARIPPPPPKQESTGDDDDKDGEEPVEPVVFDSTYVRKQPINVQVGRGDVIRGIDYALKHMTPGQKSHLVIPAEWAYVDPAECVARVHVHATYTDNSPPPHECIRRCCAELASW